MAQREKLNSLDELLRIYWLESAKELNHGLTSKELKLILEQKQSVSMPRNRYYDLIEKLHDKVSNISLGKVITQAIEEKKLTDNHVLEATAIPLDVIKDLKTDEIFTNTIPVMLLKKLFEFLSITFDKAEHAILTTYEIVTRKNMTPENNISIVTYSRRENSSSDGALRIGGRLERKQLYENKESLEMYMRKLKELMAA